MKYNLGTVHILRDSNFGVSSPSSPRAKSFPVSTYLRIKREPQEVGDTCISGDSPRDLHSR